MPIKSKRFLKRLISHIGVVFFAVAIWMLYVQLRKHSVTDILDSITQIPTMDIVFALAACAAGYLVLSCYDFLALKYIGKKLEWWKWMLAGLLGFAISNNAGNAAISGGAIRYRLYTRWRIRATEIVQMLTFSAVTYYLGASTVIAIGGMFLPKTGFADGGMMRFLFTACSAFLGAYYAVCLLLSGKKFSVGSATFKVPSIGTALSQFVVGTMDSIFAGLVLYFLARHVIDISIIEFIAIFVVAQAAGIFAQVPGGIGVFESVVMLAMPDWVDGAALFGCLVAFRIIYFLLPLAGVGTTFFIYEHYLRQRMMKWRMFSIHLYGAAKQRKK